MPAMAMPGYEVIACCPHTRRSLHMCMDGCPGSSWEVHAVLRKCEFHRTFSG